jgi:hypothetical protein
MKIVKTIRRGMNKFAPGDEAALQAVCSPEELSALAVRGLVVGGGESEPANQFLGVLGATVGDSVLESIAARISGALAVERRSDESAIEFLEGFADQCGEVAANVAEQIQQLKAKVEDAIRERDEARQESADLRDQVANLNDEITALKAATREAAPPEAPASKPAKK